MACLKREAGLEEDRIFFWTALMFFRRDEATMPR